MGRGGPPGRGGKVRDRGWERALFCMGRSIWGRWEDNGERAFFWAPAPHISASFMLVYQGDGGKGKGDGKGKGKGGKGDGKGKVPPPAHSFGLWLWGLPSYPVRLSAAEQGKGKGKGKGKGGMKGGSKVVVEAHRHAGVFVARAKEDALCTLNSTPGKDVYGEKRISVRPDYQRISLAHTWPLSVCIHDILLLRRMGRRPSPSFTAALHRLTAPPMPTAPRGASSSTACGTPSAPSSLLLFLAVGVCCCLAV